MKRAYSLTSGNLEDLSREANRAFDTELFVLCPIDQVIGNYK